MQILKINSSHPPKSVVHKVVEVLEQGGVIVYPTETAYGLGCDATNPQAVEKIYHIKGRKRGRPLPLIVANARMARQYAIMTPLAEKLAKKFWPGPLTLVLKMKNGVRLHGVKQCTAAIRISSHPVARALSHALGKPLIATSANKSGFSVCYGVFCIKKSLQRAFFKVDLVLDAGKLPKQSPSTIVDAQSEKIEILRQGAVDPRSVKLSEKLRPHLF